jgi:hypothetical protein
VSVIFIRFETNLNILTDMSKVPNMKFQENPSGGSCPVACSRTDMKRPASRFVRVRKATAKSDY